MVIKNEKKELKEKYEEIRKQIPKELLEHPKFEELLLSDLMFFQGKEFDVDFADKKVTIVLETEVQDKNTNMAKANLTAYEYKVDSFGNLDYNKIKQFVNTGGKNAWISSFSTSSTAPRWCLSTRKKSRGTAKRRTWGARRC